MFNKWSGLDHPAATKKKKYVTFPGPLFFYANNVGKEWELYVKTSELSSFKRNCTQNLTSLMLMGLEKLDRKLTEFPLSGTFI